MTGVTVGDQTKWIVRLVAGMWTINLGAGILSAVTGLFEYSPSEGVNTIFGLIIGSLFVADKTLKKEEARAEKPEPEKDKT